MYSLKVDYPDLEKGTELSMTDLSVSLVNGSTVEVSKEAADAYKEATGQTLSEGLKGNPYLKLTTKKSGGE